MSESKAFEYVVAGVIVFNTSLVGVSLLGGEHVEHVTELLETACLVFFTGELGLRIKHHGLAFFKSGWNLADLLIITLSLLPMLGVGVAVLRVGRLARLVHLGRHAVNLSALRIVRLGAMTYWRWRMPDSRLKISL